MIEYPTEKPGLPKEEPWDQIKESDMTSVMLGKEVVREALSLLESLEPGDKLLGAVEMPSRHKRINIIISPFKEDMMPLMKIEHEGATYFLGLPKGEREEA